MVVDRFAESSSVSNASGLIMDARNFRVVKQEYSVTRVVTSSVIMPSIQACHVSDVVTEDSSFYGWPIILDP